MLVATLQPMTNLIPNFYDEMDLIDDSSMPLPPLDDDDGGDEIDFQENSRKSTVTYSREVDSKASDYSGYSGGTSGKVL